MRNGYNPRSPLYGLSRRAAGGGEDNIFARFLTANHKEGGGLRPRRRLHQVKVAKYVRRQTDRKKMRSLSPVSGSALLSVRQKEATIDPLPSKIQGK